MTRVAYVCTDPGVPVFGRKGCSVHVREMCVAMTQAGLDVSLLAARRGGEAAAGWTGGRVIDLPAPTANDAAARERQAREANAETLRILRSSGPFDIVYERAALWSAAPMAYAAEASALGILELNAPLVEEQARYRVLVEEHLARAFLTSSLQAARLVVAVSDEVAAGAMALLGESEKVHVVPNGVDTRRFAPVSRERSTQDHFVVGFVGTLRPWHGLATLVDAFASFAAAVPEAHLLIVGDGPERQDVEDRLERLGLSGRATITGAVAHEDVPAWLGAMDVAVAPYPALEGFYFSPLKVTEYMAAGLPVVASAIGQIPSLVRHDCTGVLVDPGVAAGLADALRRLHADPALRRRLGQAARSFVAEHCTWSQVLARILTLAHVPCDPVPVFGR